MMLMSQKSKSRNLKVCCQKEISKTNNYKKRSKLLLGPSSNLNLEKHNPLPQTRPKKLFKRK